MPYHVQRKIKGEWQTVTTLNWLAAQRTTDKLQNRHGFNSVRMVRADDSQLARPTMGDHEDEQRRATAYGRAGAIISYENSFREILRDAE